MYNYYDNESYNFIKDIEYVKGMYDKQVNKVKQEEYMKDLLFADYVRKVKRHKSRYDYIGDNTFKEAQSQIGKKTKKERGKLEVLKGFIMEDFLNNNKNFKLTEIISGGYESYVWHINFEYFGNTIQITIPMMDSITVENIKYAYDGMFAFSIKEGSCCWSVKKMSYKIEEVAEYIKEYFQLKDLNEDDD